MLRSALPEELLPHIQRSECQALSHGGHQSCEELTRCCSCASWRPVQQLSCFVWAWFPLCPEMRFAASRCHPACHEPASVKVVLRHHIGSGSTLLVYHLTTAHTPLHGTCPRPDCEALTCQNGMAWEAVSTCESAAEGFLPLENASPSVACLRPPVPAPNADPAEQHSDMQETSQKTHPPSGRCS